MRAIGEQDESVAVGRAKDGENEVFNQESYNFWAPVVDRAHTGTFNDCFNEFLRCKLRQSHLIHPNQGDAGFVARGNALQHRMCEGVVVGR